MVEQTEYNKLCERVAKMEVKINILTYVSGATLTGVIMLVVDIISRRLV
jgi:hypothetical protein